MAEGHRQRMRKRFYKEGIDHFEPHEVLEMILYYAYPRIDTNPLAHQLIERFGSFHAVLEASREDLLEFGLTENAAAILNMVPAFSNYYMQSHSNSIRILHDCSAMGTYAVNKIGERPNEVFGMICLDTQRKIKNFEIVAEGTVNSTNIIPRKVVECALRNNAAKVAFVHNHPAGSLSPSPDDKVLTQKFTAILKAIDITVVDHIIVANGRFLSMCEQGMI